MHAPRLPVLYSFRRCPYAMRARLALAASGTACELREVVLKNKPAELLAASPKGTVPVLVLDDGTVLAQSLEIMLWALERNDPLRWLQPGTGTLGDMQALIATCDNEFKPQLDRYKYPERFGGNEAVKAAAAAEPGARCGESGASFLGALEARLMQTRQLAGDTATLADAAIMPFVRQFAMVDPAAFAVRPWPRLQAWLDGWTASALFDGVMPKLAPWQAGAPNVVFPFAPAPAPAAG